MCSDGYKSRRYQAGKERVFIKTGITDSDREILLVFLIFIQIGSIKTGFQELSKKTIFAALKSTLKWLIRTKMSS